MEYMEKLTTVASGFKLYSKTISDKSEIFFQILDSCSLAAKRLSILSKFIIYVLDMKQIMFLKTWKNADIIHLSDLSKTKNISS